MKHLTNTMRYLLIAIFTISIFFSCEKITETPNTTPIEFDAKAAKLSVSSYSTLDSLGHVYITCTLNRKPKAPWAKILVARSLEGYGTWKPQQGSWGYNVGDTILNELLVTHFDSCYSNQLEYTFVDSNQAGGSWDYMLSAVETYQGSGVYDTIWSPSHEIEIWSIPFQSNGIGVNNEGGTMSDQSYQVWQLASDRNGDYDGELKKATHPLDHDWDNGCNGVGFGIAFAKRRLALNPNTIDRILLVPRAAGGTGFISGDWKDGDPLFLAHQAAIDKAIEKTKGKYMGGIGIIGERDATAGGAATFQDNLTDYHAAQRAKYGNHIIGHHGVMAKAYIHDSVDIYKAQKEIIQAILLDSVIVGKTVTDTSGELAIPMCGNSKPVHYEGDAMEAIGVDFADDIQVLLQ